MAKTFDPGNHVISWNYDLEVPLCWDWDWTSNANVITPWTWSFHLFRLHQLEDTEEDHQDERWLLFWSWSWRTLCKWPTDKTCSSTVPPSWTRSFRSAGCKLSAVPENSTKGHRSPNMWASEDNILAESGSRGFYCHWRNRYQHCRLLGHQIEIRNERKVRTAILSVRLCPVSLME